MNLASAIRAMIAAGATPEMLLAVVEADQRERDVALMLKREKDAERQRRHRESRDVTVTGRDTRDPLSPSEEPEQPSTIENNQPLSHPPYSPPALSKTNGFAQFWEAYPNRVGKRVAETAYQRALKRANAETILAGLERAKVSRQWDDGFIPHPTTWLNQDRWADEPAEVARPPPYSPSQIQAASDEAAFREACKLIEQQNAPARDNQRNQSVVVPLSEARQIASR